MPQKPESSGRSYRGTSADERRDERRRRLIEAGIKVIGRDGYNATTVRSVCAEAGLTERYFYEAIGDRERLLGAVYEQLTAQLQQQIATAIGNSPPDPTQMARVALTCFFSAMRADPNVAKILLFEVLGISPEVTRLTQTAIADFAKLIRLAAKLSPGLAIPEREEELLTAGLVGAVVFIAMTWTLERFRRPLDDVVSSALTIFNAVVQAER